MRFSRGSLYPFLVAPREGRVSRNVKDIAKRPKILVAPREGRVSRNFLPLLQPPFFNVAPREGRVSRNFPVEV